MYLVSELVEGASLAETLAAGRFRERAAVRVAGDVLNALSHAHGRGVVHRDVKPANILVDLDGRGRLTDFGVARLAGESGLTATGALVGTMAYMAPEQARGGRVGAPADVYAATLVLYEALVGRNPLAGDSPAETARRAAEADIPPLGTERPDLPRPLIAAVDAGLRRKPGDRPDPDDLAAALGRATSGIGLGRGAARLAPAASAVGGRPWARGSPSARVAGRWSSAPPRWWAVLRSPSGRASPCSPRRWPARSRWGCWAASASPWCWDSVRRRCWRWGRGSAGSPCCPQ